MIRRNLRIVCWLSNGSCQAVPWLSNTDAVMWSLAYRSNPMEDVHIEPYRSTGHAPKSGPGDLDSTLLIDATLKYPMPPLALPGREFMERAQELWKELGLLASPFSHLGTAIRYSLGDWTDSREQFARSAVDGAWANNGDNTWSRRPDPGDAGAYGRELGEAGQIALKGQDDELVMNRGPVLLSGYLGRGSEEWRSTDSSPVSRRPVSGVATRILPKIGRRAEGTSVGTLEASFRRSHLALGALAVLSVLSVLGPAA